MTRHRIITEQFELFKEYDSESLRLFFHYMMSPFDAEEVSTRYGLKFPPMIIERMQNFPDEVVLVKSDTESLKSQTKNVLIFKRLRKILIEKWEKVNLNGWKSAFNEGFSITIPIDHIEIDLTLLR